MSPIRPAILALGAALALTGCGGSPPPAPKPSVLVQTQPATQGSLPDVVTVYGTATPATGALQTLALKQPAQIKAILVSPGAQVRAGQQLIAYNPDPMSVSAYRQAADNLKLAQAQLVHMNQLVTQQLATRDQVTQAETAGRNAQAALTALMQQGAGAPSGRVSAPFNGLVVTIPVAVGDQTAAGAPLATVARNGSLVIVAGFNPLAAARLRVGQPAALQSLAGGPPVQGHVMRISAALDPRNRLINADIAVDSGVILGDAFRAAVTVGQVSGWLAPHAAVLNDAQGDYVFQVSGRHAKRVDVQVISSTGVVDVVKGPLDPRLPLVAVGAYQLEPGALVRIATKR
jgi:RND family efflux transporter MFP subunit